ncbi:MAG: ABC transporter ATP-binding protein [Nocardioidaceae bacterium]|nr:ABC transporter ATP-binding protein [Nocardioidaceae bacterium]
MTSSSDAPPDDLPRALPAMWRLVRLGYHAEPRLLVTAFVLALLTAVPDVLLALWLALLGSGVTSGDATQVWVGAVGLAVSATLIWLLRTVSTRLQRRFRDKVSIALERHVAALQASVATVAHQERPEYLDRLSVLRDQVFVLDHLFMSLFGTAGYLLRLVGTVVLLMGVHPALGLLVVAAAPTVLASGWRPAVERQAREHGAQAERLAGHLYQLSATASSAKEVRVLGIGDQVAARRRSEWERWYALMARARWGSAVWYTLAWADFALGYVAAVVFTASGIDASAAAVLLVLAAGGRLSGYISMTVGEIGFLRGIWMDGSQRLAWLEDYAAAQVTGDRPAPDRIEQGLRVEHVTFTYPGASRPALDDVDLWLPAGSVVAVVGENGAGKSTLVKLLAQMYTPDSGRVLVDGRPLDELAPGAWRERLAGAFQDFFRFELPAQQAVGVGDLPRLDDEPAATGAVRRAGAEDVVARLEQGLSTQLGPSWPEGVDLSFGQWQKLALARGFMREAPLLLVLDEPTAALDAETEHALFERYASVARASDADALGRVMILVSHRFSTVRMADLIVVLDGARVTEVGSHDELIRLGGQYATLYETQAAAYR